jgi:hypothetical protein
MRIITLALAALTLGTIAARKPEAPRPLVIFVHGRGQLGADTAMLRRDWQRDLESGLSAAGEQVLRDEDVRLAWYADVLDPESDADCALASRDTADVGFATFAREMFMHVRLDDTTVDTRGARNILSDVLYVMDPGKRCAAQQRLASVIEGEIANRPIVIVAYSLGALVAYDYLRSAPVSVVRNVSLVTLGSPLGIPLLRDLFLDGPAPTVPDGLKMWVNIYDPDDMLAAPLRFSGDTLRLRDRTTLQAADDPHGAGRYLRDPATIAAVREALISSQ